MPTAPLIACHECDLLQRETRLAAGGTAKTGRSSVREPTSGTGFDALVAAHSRALASVSRDIAGAIRAQ